MEGVDVFGCPLGSRVKEAWDAIDTAIIQKCCLTNAMNGTEGDILWNDEMEAAVCDNGLYDDQYLISDNQMRLLIVGFRVPMPGCYLETLELKADFVVCVQPALCVRAY